jgi:phosphoribosylformylglycinamidine cyclo-ligase
MRRTFNCGIGMIAVVPESSAQEVIERLEVMGERAWIIGEIVRAANQTERIQWV